VTDYPPDWPEALTDHFAAELAERYKKWWESLPWYRRAWINVCDRVRVCMYWE